jgi:predicted PurR-regulated permease PerM
VTGRPANWLSSRRIAAAAVLGLTLWLIRSFLIPLIWAAVFAIANWPLYRRSAQHVPQAMRGHVLPLAFSILITFLVLGPIVFAFGILARQSQVCLILRCGESASSAYRIACNVAEPPNG